MTPFIRHLTNVFLGAVIATTVAPYAYAQPEEILKGRSASENIAFGQITRVQDHRLDIIDGKTARSVLVMPETIVEIDGKPATLDDLPPNARVQIHIDQKRPDVAKRVLLLPEGEAGPLVPVVDTPVVPKPMVRPTTTPPLPNAVETAEERTANELESKMTPVVITDPVARPDLGGTLETTLKGVRVVSVEPNGPLALSGLQVGDYIKQIGGENISTPTSLYRVLDRGPAGVNFPILYTRGGKVMTGNFHLLQSANNQAVKDGAATHASKDRSGKPTPTHRKITSDSLGWTLVMPGETVKIESVQPQSPAAMSGLKAGDHVINVDDQRATSPAGVMDYIQFQQRDSSARLTIDRNGERLHRDLTLPPSLTMAARKFPAESPAADSGANPNSSDELQSLRQMQEDQQKQIEELQSQVSSLQAVIEAMRSGASTSTPPTFKDSQPSVPEASTTRGRYIPAVPPAPEAPASVEEENQ